MIIDKTVMNNLKKILAAVVNVPAANIDNDKSMVIYGIDSIKIIVMLQKINKKFNVDLKAGDILTHATLCSLAALIQEQQNHTHPAL